MPGFSSLRVPTVVMMVLSGQADCKAVTGRVEVAILLVKRRKVQTAQ